MKIYQCTRCGKIFLNEHEADMHSLAFVGHGIWKVLRAIHLPLKAEWYDMIESGEKPEEYREIKPHWLKNLCYQRIEHSDCYPECKCEDCLMRGEYLAYPFDAVVFRYGYTKKYMVWSIDEISIGQGRAEWGAPENKETFIIKLKERLV